MKVTSAIVLAIASIVSAIPDVNTIQNMAAEIQSIVKGTVPPVTPVTPSVPTIPKPTPQTYPSVPNTSAPKPAPILGLWSYATLSRDQIDQTCNKLLATECYKNLLCNMDDEKCQAINLIKLHHKAEEICEKYKTQIACQNAPDGKFLGNYQVCKWDDNECKTNTLGF